MTVRIEDLPNELLVAIFSHMPAAQLMCHVSLVCRRFNDVVRSEWYWHTRYTQRSGIQLPGEAASLALWQRGCLQCEFLEGARHNKLEFSRLRGAVGSLDCVHIMHPGMSGLDAVIVAGSRDSSILRWSKRSSGTGGGRELRDVSRTALTGHKGWVWSLASNSSRPQLLCSGGWDHNVRLWDVVVCTSVCEVKRLHPAAILCLGMPEPNVVVTGSYDKHVRLLDLRQPVSVQSSYKEHTRPVLTLAATDWYIYTGSEDKTLCVWDRRNEKELQRIKFPTMVPSIHLYADMLSAAGSKIVKLYDCSQGSLKQISSFSPGYSQPVTRVLHTLGMVVTASKSGEVKLHGLNSSHQCVTTLTHHHSAATGLDFSRNVLAIASSDRDVSLWTHNQI